MEDSERRRLEKQSLLPEDCLRGLRMVLEKRSILAKRLLESGPISKASEEVMQETIYKFNETIKKYFNI